MSSTSLSASQRAGARHTAGPSSASRTPRRNKNANDLLRNYYGISESKDDGGEAAKGIAGGNAADAPADRDPRDTDSGRAFDAELAFRHLLQTKSLAELLRAEADLLTEIRELDGERQSLVYNHHHELVSASETMRSMKEQADALVPQLGLLQSSVQEISKTSTALTPAQAGIESTTTSQSSLLAKAAPVIELPRRLRDILALEGAAAGLPKAQSLWGSMEAVLASWDEAGVVSAKDIMAECRHVLREAQQSDGLSG